MGKLRPRGVKRLSPRSPKSSKVSPGGCSADCPSGPALVRASPPPRGRLIPALPRCSAKSNLSGLNLPAGCPLQENSVLAFSLAALKRHVSRGPSGNGERSERAGSALRGAPWAEAWGARSPCRPRVASPDPDLALVGFLPHRLTLCMEENAGKSCCPRICLGCPLGRQAPARGQQVFADALCWAPRSQVRLVWALSQQLQGDGAAFRDRGHFSLGQEAGGEGCVGRGGHTGQFGEAGCARWVGGRSK